MGLWEREEEKGERGRRKVVGSPAARVEKETQETPPPACLFGEEVELLSMTSLPLAGRGRVGKGRGRTTRRKGRIERRSSN